MLYGQFHEALLPVGISAGMRRTTRDGVSIVTLASGSEERNRSQRNLRRTWSVSYGLLGARGLARLSAFYDARGGRTYGFRARDWLDWTTARHGECGLCAPTPCDDLLVDLAAHVGPPVFPLWRRYPSIGRETKRRIFKPRCAHFGIAMDGEPLTSGWRLDPARGLVIFEDRPTGERLTWGGVYDTPIRFDSELSLDLEMVHLGSAEGIALKELSHERDVMPETPEDEFAAMQAGDEDDLAAALEYANTGVRAALEAPPE